MNEITKKLFELKYEQLSRINLVIEINTKLEKLDSEFKNDLNIFIQDEMCKCVFCGSVNLLNKFRNRFICEKCIDNLA